MKKHLSYLATAALIASPALAEDLTVTSFGGAYGAAQMEHMIQPYMDKSGTNILFEDYGGGVAEMKAQVEAGNILWDVVDIEVIDLERACAEGYLEVIDQSVLPDGDDGTPAADDFIDDALANECGVGNIVWSVVFAVNTENGEGPKTIEDFFDTEAFPGKRGLRKRPQVNMEWALLADGVAPEEVYEVLATEEGQKRAFAKLDTIKDAITWYDSWSQAPVLLNDGGATMVQSANGRIFAAIKDDGAPFEIVWDSHIYDLDVWAIMKGTEKKEEAMEFIKFATGTVPLSGMQDVAYGPTRASAQALLPEDVKQDLPTAHLDEGVKADGIFWADYGETLGEKFNEWLLQ
ncbi:MULTISPECIES: ABC transporter substrate-binding protein [unclassified Sulfitobacter]|uniref:ABC transporter substrate-binding protein n=1 Tax=unclassified Sulfitobacter TaxID=196795 RepID=UPI0023E2C6CC|nr:MULTISPECIES: ABC transporter substrate-binding protein [unclassified Sulfitobacter]MDF3381935.1 ABC transporter substrate-binding protein [Sulfitobacter sp. Ks11]MDF3385354.1 ABC transporter substrate-binding protein [Sulfitobacter sp. M85]MDF3388773.1 ABC transporter substrate-binding protein [Sulfitobacter sp. Ks16]MDF3399410.1 ABC transporter substrate-binding protein [Sulfitobacter sp. KE39]MDF3402831.1 ABC transporter substrate-binding protein [Sulfitobacter sp. Ks35]